MDSCVSVGFAMIVGGATALLVALILLVAFWLFYRRYLGRVPYTVKWHEDDDDDDLARIEEVLAKVRGEWPRPDATLPYVTDSDPNSDNGD